VKVRCAAIAVGAWAVSGAVVMAAAPPAQANWESFTVCPSGQTAVATPDTSCEFADTVRWAWYHQSGSTVFALSPKTGLVYTMQCAWTVTNVWVSSKHCFGINSYGAPLSVYIET
jgi:hypothetical protein